MEKNLGLSFKHLQIQSTRWYWTSSNSPDLFIINNCLLFIMTAFFSWILKDLFSRESSRNQQALLNEIFSYMRAFQDWIVGEVSWFQSIVYYTIACIICALFSSSKRTVDARITLFVLLSLNVTVERMLVQYNINVMSPEDKVTLFTFK